MTLRFLLEKEFKQIIRDPFMPRLILFMPVMMILILPFAANYEVKNLRLTIIDNDKSPYSARLANKAGASGYFQTVAYAHSGDEALRHVEADKADIILEISPDFEKDLVNGGVAEVMVSANAVNGMKGGLGASYLSAIVNDFAADISSEQSTVATQGSASPQVRLVPHNKYNTYLDYKVFMIPALAVMLLTMLAGFLPALNIVGEKEAGTIEQINVTPVSRLTFILAKLIPYWLIGLVALSLSLLFAAAAYGLIPEGNILLIYTYAAAYILVVSGMGLVISNYSDTMQQAMFVTFFFVLILVLLSGLFTPINSMPQWAQVVARCNPLSYFIQAMRAIYLKGSGLADLLPQLFALLGFAALLNTWAIISYQKSH